MIFSFTLTLGCIKEKVKSMTNKELIAAIRNGDLFKVKYLLTESEERPALNVAKGNLAAV